MHALARIVGNFSIRVKKRRASGSARGATLAKFDENRGADQDEKWEC